MEIDSKNLDNWLDAYIDGFQNISFSLDNITEHIQKISGYQDLRALENRLARELKSDKRLFYDWRVEQFFLKKEFFKGKQFLITPSEFEIEEGILVPGHRFCAFCAQEIFPSEVTLKATTKTNSPVVEKTIAVGELVPLHLLLGAEQIFDFFVAENQSNKALLENYDSSSEVKLNVFDFANFYQEHQFEYGDAILVEIDDWEQGIFSIKEYHSADQRKNKALVKWVDAMAVLVEKVIDHFEDYFEIPEQLQYAFLVGKDKEDIWRDVSGSLDEFIAKNDRIVINFESEGHTVLARKPFDSEVSFSATPLEGVAISEGATGLKDILSEINCKLTLVELQAYMKNQLYQREYDFSNFFERCFGKDQLKFVDEAQEAIFLNLLEEQFESFSELYNCEEDKDKAALRIKILELTEERCNWLEELRSLEVDLNHFTNEQLSKFRENSLILNEMLELLNSDKHSLRPGDEKELSARIDELADIQLIEIEKLETALKLDK